MKTILTFCLYCSLQLLSLCIRAQETNTCDCLVLMNPDFSGKTELYDNKGNIIKYLEHNFRYEDFIVFHLKEDNDSLFKVTARYSLVKGGVSKGWIKKSAVIGTYLTSYKGNIAIYSEPSKKSNKSTIPEWTNQLVQISACKSNWVKISLWQKGKLYIGWIPPETQCANPYTTCN